MTSEFRRVVWRHYRKHGRHDLPWRKTKDPYKILVSEVMLQQTQVERVKFFYERFIERFPTAKALAAAPLADVLTAWQGLGYNRRARMLRDAAKEIATNGMPSNPDGFEALPGVGPYTARAVSAFAHNTDGIFIETNIRTVVIHHFFSRKKLVNDREIEKILAAAFPKGRAREWYWALMDYGAYLKRSGISHNANSKSYTKQTKFSGSLREARGAVLRELTKGAQPKKRLLGLLGDNRAEQAARALDALIGEGMVVVRATRVALAT